MRKNILLIAFILGSIFIWSSCTDKNDINDPKVNFSSAKAYFYGDPQGHNLYYYDLFLYDKALTASENNSGTMAYLALNCPITDKNEITSSTYRVNSANSPQLYTFERGSWDVNSQTNERTAVGSYIGIVRNGKVIDYKLIISGSVVITKSSAYTVSGTVTTEDNKQYQLSFRGTVPFIDMIEPLTNTLSKGQLWYIGDAYSNNLNVYTIRLGASDVDLSNFSGSGDAMQIEVYTPKTATNGIPSGTYPIKLINENIVNSALAGEYNSNDNADYGTIYYTSDKLFVNQGTIVITNKGNNNYNLNFNLKDDYYGYNIIRNFDMNLPFINRTSGIASQNIRMKMPQRVKSERINSLEGNKFDRYEVSNRKTVSEINKR